jgi:hypothetical protein
MGWGEDRRSGAFFSEATARKSIAPGIDIGQFSCIPYQLLGSFQEIP